MPGSDVVVAWVEPGSRYVMMDAWVDSYSLPIPDAKQSISNISAAAANGLISFFFSRATKTNDPTNDIDFDECFHFIFPVGGGSVDIKNRIVMKHDLIPTVTTQKFCFNTCHSKSTTSSKPPAVTKPSSTTSVSLSTTSIPRSTTTTSTTTTTTTTSTTPAPPVTENPVSSEESEGNSNKDEISLPGDSSSSSSSSSSASRPTPVFPVVVNQSRPPVSSSSSSSSKRISQDEISLVSDCKGEWKYPSRCTGYGCDYKATWEYLDDDDEILFTLSTKHRNKWTGIAFSNDKAMPQTDAIIGLVEDSGRFFLMDTWLRSYAAPSLDPVQNIQNMTVRRENGITSLRFTRRRRTGDRNDYQFSDTNCPYFMFPVQGGVFNAVNKRLRKHESVPLISDSRICVKSCRPKPSTTSTTTTTTTTTTTAAPVTTTTTTTTTTRAPPPSPKVNFNELDLSNLGPSVVDLSKFNGKIPDLTSLSQNASISLQSLMEQMNVNMSSLSSAGSKTDFPSLIRNLAGKLPSSIKNDSHFATLFNQHTSSSSSGQPASFPTPKHTSDHNDHHHRNQNNNNKKEVSKKDPSEDDGEESEDEEENEGVVSHSVSISSASTPSSSSPTSSTSTSTVNPLSTSFSYAPASPASTTKAPNKNVTPKTPKIPSRWSTSRTTTSTTSSTTSPPKTKSDHHGNNHDKHNKPSNEVLDEGEGSEGGEDEEDVEEETESPTSSVNGINGNINNNHILGGKNKKTLTQESKYVVELKFPKAWKASFVRRQSEEYLKFKEKIEHQVKKELSDQFSALEVKVMDLTAAPQVASLSSGEDFSQSTIAKLKLSLKSSSLPSSVSDTASSTVSSSSSSSSSSPSSSSNHPKGKTQEVREEGNSLSSSSSSSSSSSTSISANLPTPVRLTEALNLAIKDGRVGDVAVDSSYLIVRSLDDGLDYGKEGPLLTDEQLKWTVIVGGVALLVLLVLVQAVCMVYRDKRNRSRNLSKDIISNWKDGAIHHHPHLHGHHVSTGAYSYENFAVTDDPDGLLGGSPPLHSRSNGKIYILL